jgi:protein TonB
MFNVSIYNKNWINLVFEDKNQDYGAYQLRKENPKTTLLSLFYGTLLLGGFIAFFVAKNMLNPINSIPVSNPFQNETITLSEEIFILPKINEVKETVALPVKKSVVEDVQHLSNLVVAQSSEIIENTPVNAILNNTSSSQSTEGSANGIINDNSTISGNGIASTIEIINEPFKTVEVDNMPTFPGGMEKFYQYVGSNFSKPDVESGKIISIIVSFIVEKDGTMSNIKILRNPGYGLGNEAIRVLKSLKTKWIPGKKNGEFVRTEYTLPIKIKAE